MKVFVTYLWGKKALATWWSLFIILSTASGFSTPGLCSSPYPATCTPSSQSMQKRRRRQQSSTLLFYDTATDNSDNSGNGNNTSDSGACPFSMTFPRYRIPISGGKDPPTKGNNILSGLFSGMLISAQKSEFERKYSPSKAEVMWYDPKSKLSPDDEKDKNDEKIERGKIGVHVSAFVWRALANLLQESIESATLGQGDTSVEKSVIIGLPNASLVGLKQLADIINWMGEEERYYLPPSVKSKINIQASVEEDSPVPTIILTRKGVPISQTNSNKVQLDEDIVRERTKAWVDRVLVKMRICPFTRSTTKSGQGLRDVGVPVGDIAYHYSSAHQSQFPLIMADTWEAISEMVKAGPNSISSILLAAPEFDGDFSLWAGPLFAMLEANCCASRAEPIIGIVCFHPKYRTPDGQSWPGFGHMHSAPRLGKWLKENDEELFNKVDDTDISAGGAFQRRTPHATINVLRAEQLEAAEGRRSTGSLYSVNIRRLYEEGFQKLEDDLRREQNLKF